MALTERGQAELERYLSEVRRSMARDGEADVEDVVAGIREHVEAEVEARGADPATGEDVSDVLDRLGPPSTYTGDVDRSAGAAGSGRGPARIALVLSGAGVMLLLSGLWGSAGLGLLVAGLVASRLALEDAPVEAPETRATRLVWIVGAAAGGVAVLLAPAGLVWGAGQTGGVLEHPLADWAGASDGRPLRYWIGLASIGGAVTGVWWIGLGWALRRSGDRLRRALGPARWAVPARAGRFLLVAGVLLSLLALLAVLP